MLKWQKEYIGEISKMSNEDLIYEVINSAGGDDYEGCFTNRGQWCFDKAKELLEKRLKENKFL